MASRTRTRSRSPAIVPTRGRRRFNRRHDDDDDDDDVGWFPPWQWWPLLPLLAIFWVLPLLAIKILGRLSEEDATVCAFAAGVLGVAVRAVRPAFGFWKVFAVSWLLLFAASSACKAYRVARHRAEAMRSGQLRAKLRAMDAREQEEWFAERLACLARRRASVADLARQRYALATLGHQRLCGSVRLDDVDILDKVAAALWTSQCAQHAGQWERGTWVLLPGASRRMAGADRVGRLREGVPADDGSVDVRWYDVRWTWDGVENGGVARVPALTLVLLAEHTSDSRDVFLEHFFRVSGWCVSACMSPKHSPSEQLACCA